MSLPDQMTRHGVARFFALKMMKKTEVMRLKQVEHMRDEKQILMNVNHPFLIIMCATTARSDASLVCGCFSVRRRLTASALTQVSRLPRSGPSIHAARVRHWRRALLTYSKVYIILPLTAL